jgi:hypothetical protein
LFFFFLKNHFMIMISIQQKKKLFFWSTFHSFKIHFFFISLAGTLSPYSWLILNPSASSQPKSSFSCSSQLFFFFFWYWGLNSGRTPPLFCDRFFQDRVFQTICWAGFKPQ